MNLAGLTQEELAARCAWCHRRMPRNQECFGLGARVRADARHLLAGHEGKLIALPLTSGRELIAIIPGATSEARAAGNDVYFQICSERCSAQLSEAMRAELADHN